MKTKNLLLTFLFIAFSVPVLHAQNVSLRGLVAVVKPNFSKPATDFLTEFSARLKEKGYTDASERISKFSKGGFGSGFVILILQMDKVMSLQINMWFCKQNPSILNS